jgi:Protein of unknown function (DUF3037)
MPENLSFEYAVIRVVPKVEREEFFNVGVILYCPGQKFLKTLWQLDEERLRVFCNKMEMAELRENLLAFEKVCNSDPDSGAIGKLPIAERFRWLTATRSTVLQTSRVHPGLCNDGMDMLKHLYGQLVL